eukprot:10201450-Lingulodinium_polyedra.AAC.1
MLRRPGGKDLVLRVRIRASGGHKVRLRGATSRAAEDAKFHAQAPRTSARPGPFLCSPGHHVLHPSALLDSPGSPEPGRRDGR